MTKHNSARGVPACDPAQSESAAFDQWWTDSGQGSEPLHTLITENCARAAWHERARRAAGVKVLGHQVSSTNTPMDPK